MRISDWSSDVCSSEFDRNDIVFLGTEARETTNDAPVWFVGQALPEQLAGVNLDGAVALILYDAPEGAPGYSKRAEALTKAGAAAVIAIMGDDIPWPAVTGSYKRGQTKLGTDSRAPITGAMALGAGERLVRTGGGDVASARAIAFRPVPLDLTASLAVSTQVRPSTSHK